MKPRHVWIGALMSACTLLASAQEAHSTRWVNLRAGPARDYPLVARLGPGSPLAVQGCTDGFGWCDVVGPGEVRGWIYAGNIAYPYQSSQVPVITYGAVIGIPIVTFIIGDYWGHYYRNRPWYGRQSHWAHRPPPRPGWRPPHGPPPRPIVRPPGPRPPGVHPLPGPRPPPGVRPPPGARPPGAHTPGARPPGARPPGGGGRPPGGGPGGRPDRPDGGQRPQPR